MKRPAWLQRRPQAPGSCSLAEILLSLGSASPSQGRASNCEIHLDGNLFFWVAGRLTRHKVLTRTVFYISHNWPELRTLSWRVRGGWGGSGLLVKSGHHHGGQEEEEEERGGSSGVLLAGGFGLAR